MQMSVSVCVCVAVINAPLPGAQCAPNEADNRQVLPAKFPTGY